MSTVKPPVEEPGWLKRLAGLGQALLGSSSANRRRYRRYEVAALAQVAAGDKTFECEVANVSTGGALLMPALPLGDGTAFTLTHPSSTISLTGRVIAKADDGTRIEFDQPTAGAIVSAWMRAS
ncbi:MAG: PilZ domain-containing protein [Rhodospirillaceae bacterium]|nr:PilZ domain-containing protein [Rhodospirillaceae bacterium]